MCNITTIPATKQQPPLQLQNDVPEDSNQAKSPAGVTDLSVPTGGLLHGKDGLESGGVPGNGTEQSAAHALVVVNVLQPLPQKPAQRPH